MELVMKMTIVFQTLIHFKMITIMTVQETFVMMMTITMDIMTQMMNFR